MREGCFCYFAEYTLLCGTSEQSGATSISVASTVCIQKDSVSVLIVKAGGSVRAKKVKNYGYSVLFDI